MPLDDLRPARAERPVRRAPADLREAHLPARARASCGPATCSSAATTASSPSRSSTASSRSATRSSSTRGRAASTSTRRDALGVPAGPARGLLQAGEPVAARGRPRRSRPRQVLGPARPGRKVVLSGDTAPSAPVLEAALGAELLVHEATFSTRSRSGRGRPAHSTALRGGRARARGRGRPARAHAPLEPLLRPRGRRARRVTSSPTRSCRGTSISSTCRSRSGARRGSSRAARCTAARTAETAPVPEPEAADDGWFRSRWPRTIAEAEEIQAILRAAGIESELESAVEHHPHEIEDAPQKVLVPESQLEAAQDAIEALTEPGRLLDSVNRSRTSVAAGAPVVRPRCGRSTRTGGRSPRRSSARPTSPGRRVLDVGCGTGALAAAARRRRAKVWGVDASAEMLEVARRSAPGARASSSAAAEALPFKDGWFERAVMWRVAHLRRSAARFAELGRVLAPGGRLAVATFDAGALRPLLAEHALPVDRARSTGRASRPRRTLDGELSGRASASVRSGAALADRRRSTRATRSSGSGSATSRRFDLLPDDEYRGRARSAPSGSSPSASSTASSGGRRRRPPSVSARAVELR